MIPRVLIDTADIPGSKEKLRLIQRGTEFSIMLGANELMNSRLSGSEEALGTIACAKLASCANPNVLIGGLGMGFTLRAILAELGNDAKITIVELVPAVVAWAKGPMADHHGASLSDPRSNIVIDDVAALIRNYGAGYDAILLDVDNGPDGLTKDANDHLYSTGGLGRILSALRVGGVLAIWSAAPDRAFTNRLSAAGFAVEEIAVRAHKRKSGARHLVWLATKITDKFV